jgi:outer membrane protein
MSKRFWIACMALCALVALPGTGRAEDVKLGYVDTAKIFEQFKAAQDAQKLFDREVDKWNKDLQDQKKEIENLRKELENQSLVLTDAKRREKEAALSRKQSDYQSQVDGIWGPHGQATAHNAALVKDVIDKVKRVLDDYARKENYTLILDSAGGQVLFALKSYDLTDKVLELLNSGAGDLPATQPH